MNDEHKAKLLAFDQTIERLTPIVLKLLMKHYPTGQSAEELCQQLKKTVEESVVRGELTGDSDKGCAIAAATWLGVMVAIRSASATAGGAA